MKIMKMSFRRKLSVLAEVACLVALAMQQAKANMITIDYSAISSYPEPYASVLVNEIDTTHATITFTADSTGGYTYLLSSPGVNVNASTFTVNSLFYFTQKSGNKEGGFGNFNLVLDTGSGFPKAVGSLSFNVVDTSGTWASASDVLTPNGGGSEAAAHIYVLSSPNATSALITGFAGNETTTDVPDGGATALLLGAALTGIGLLRRKLS